MTYCQIMINESKATAVEVIDKRISKLQNMAKEYDEKHGKANRRIYEEIQKLVKKRNDVINGVNESADIEEDEESDIKPSRMDKKKSVADANISGEKKYNAFCLSVSGYDIPKLENTLANKKAELAKAKEKKKRAKSHTDRKVIDAEISYLTKACHKCGEMIRKRKSYNKKFASN